MAKRPTRNEDAMGAQEIAQALRERIRKGLVRVGAILPTERELQAEFNVSRSTVRRALVALCESGWAQSSPNRGVIAKHGSAVPKTSNVAFVDHAESIQRDLFFLLGRSLQEFGYHLVHIDSHAHGMEGAIEYAAEQGFAGALVWSKVGYPDAARLKAAMAEMPIIAVDHSLQTLTTDLVTLDNFEGARIAVDHLARLGRKRIAITGMMDMLEINHQRFSGYLKALFDNDLTPHAHNFCFCHTSGQPEPDAVALRRRLSDPDRPDAVFVMNDFLAPEVMDAIEQAGLRVPEDVAVAAFGRTWPPVEGAIGLTSIDIDWNEMARVIAQRLIDRLKRPLDPFVTVALPVCLMVRGSCGAPEWEWTPVRTEAKSQNGNGGTNGANNKMRLKSPIGARPK